MAKPRKRIPCRKVTLSWTIEEESELIANVKLYPCLYDPEFKHPKYGTARSLSWQSILVSFGKEHATADECQAKWNVMRGSYRRLLHRGRVPYAIEPIATNAWPHIRAIEFLREYIKPFKRRRKAVEIIQVNSIRFF